MATAGYFPPRASDVKTHHWVRRALCIAKQNSRPPPSSAAASALSGSGTLRPPSEDRHEGGDSRGRSGKGPLPMTDHDDVEPLHNSSPTDQVITEL